MRDVNSRVGMRHVVFKGGTLVGERPPLVLIHGAGGSHLHWPPEIRRLRGEFVYSLDLPGHGQSSGKPEESIAAYAQHLIQWMDAQGLMSVVLVGHSMGGAIALKLVLKAADRIAGLILIGTGAKLRVHPQILALTEEEASYSQALELITTWAFSSKADDRLVELAQMQMKEVDRHVMRADFLACDQFDVMDRLPEIDVPTLVLCGTEDLMTPVKFSRYLVERIPNAKLELIENAGHMLMLEKPEQVAGRIADFMKMNFMG